MSGRARYRILTPNGLASFDVFTVAAVQPPEANGDWLLMVSDYSGEPLMVHATRLIPLPMPICSAEDNKPRIICHTCGHVEGIDLDKTECPHRHAAPCGLFEAAAARA